MNCTRLTSILVEVVDGIPAGGLRIKWTVGRVPLNLIYKILLKLQYNGTKTLYRTFDNLSSAVFLLHKISVLLGNS